MRAISVDDLFKAGDGGGRGRAHADVAGDDRLRDVRDANPGEDGEVGGGPKYDGSGCNQMAPLNLRRR